MRRCTRLGSSLAALALAAGCGAPTSQTAGTDCAPKAPVQQEEVAMPVRTEKQADAAVPGFDAAGIAKVEAALAAKHGAGETDRIRVGVAQAAALWLPADGDLEAFTAFCLESYEPDEAGRAALFARFEDAMEQVLGHLHELRRFLREPIDLDRGPVRPLDKLFAEASAPDGPFARDVVAGVARDDDVGDVLAGRPGSEDDDVVGALGLPRDGRTEAGRDQRERGEPRPSRRESTGPHRGTITLQRAAVKRPGSAIRHPGVAARQPCGHAGSHLTGQELRPVGLIGRLGLAGHVLAIHALERVAGRVSARWRRASSNANG